MRVYHTEICILLLFRMLSLYNHTETYWKNFSIIHIFNVLSFFSITVFQCDFQHVQCHILIVRRSILSSTITKHVSIPQLHIWKIIMCGYTYLIAFSNFHFIYLSTPSTLCTTKLENDINTHNAQKCLICAWVIGEFVSKCSPIIVVSMEWILHHVVNGKICFISSVSNFSTSSLLLILLLLLSDEHYHLQRHSSLTSYSFNAFKRWPFICQAFKLIPTTWNNLCVEWELLNYASRYNTILALL